MTRIVLIHGGFYPAMNALRFWIEPGVDSELRNRGHDVTAPDRTGDLSTWKHEAQHLADAMRPDGAAHIVAGSNGCSVAVRLAVDHPGLVQSLLLCWPAVAGDRRVDAGGLLEMQRNGASRHTAETLLQGETLRGVADEELRSLQLAVGIIAAEPPDPAHPLATADRLLGILGHARSLGAFPVPFHPGFQHWRDDLVHAISTFVKNS